MRRPSLGVAAAALIVAAPALAADDLKLPRQTVELIGSGRTGAHSTFPTAWVDDQGKGSESMK